MVQKSHSQTTRLDGAKNPGKEWDISDQPQPQLDAGFQPLPRLGERRIMMDLTGSYRPWPGIVQGHREKSKLLGFGNSTGEVGEVDHLEIGMKHL